MDAWMRIPNSFVIQTHCELKNITPKVLLDLNQIPVDKEVEHMVLCSDKLIRSNSNSDPHGRSSPTVKIKSNTFLCVRTRTRSRLISNVKGLCTIVSHLEDNIEIQRQYVERLNARHMTIDRSKCAICTHSKTYRPRVLLSITWKSPSVRVLERFTKNPLHRITQPRIITTHSAWRHIHSETHTRTHKGRIMRARVLVLHVHTYDRWVHSSASLDHDPAEKHYTRTDAWWMSRRVSVVTLVCWWCWILWQVTR